GGLLPHPHIPEGFSSPPWHLRVKIQRRLKLAPRATAPDPCSLRSRPAVSTRSSVIPAARRCTQSLAFTKAKATSQRSCCNRSLVAVGIKIA
ncbi:MAG: hypothetical protein RR720_02400, partial [Comamonas sp.]|uniref:hypothetical protein n=1 Tax=Comamonas sp. TaxID=34028 RepID=UPI002FC648C3